MGENKLTIYYDKESLNKTIGQKCIVIGIYEIIEIPKKKILPDSKIETWPIVLLKDNTQILLDSFHFKERERPKEEQKKLIGKTVEASGFLHFGPPLPEGRAQNIGMFCLSPVYEVNAWKK
jgi:hypothetical protein